MRKRGFWKRQRARRRLGISKSPGPSGIGLGNNEIMFHEGLLLRNGPLPTAGQRARHRQHRTLRPPEPPPCRKRPPPVQPFPSHRRRQHKRRRRVASGSSREALVKCAMEGHQHIGSCSTHRSRVASHAGLSPNSAGRTQTPTGKAPVSRRQNITPQAYTSTVGVIEAKESRCFGAISSGVQRMVEAISGVSSTEVFSVLPRRGCRAGLTRRHTLNGGLNPLGKYSRAWVPRHHSAIDRLPIHEIRGRPTTELGNVLDGHLSGHGSDVLLITALVGEQRRSVRKITTFFGYFGDLRERHLFAGKSADGGLGVQLRLLIGHLVWRRRWSRPLRLDQRHKRQAPLLTDALLYAKSGKQCVGVAGYLITTLPVTRMTGVRKQVQRPFRPNEGSR